VVLACIFSGLPSVVHAGRQIGIDAALVIPAAYRQLIGAIETAAAGLPLQTKICADRSTFSRIILSSSICVCIYAALVLGLFRFS
jgi:polysaccharide transporter, PST family